MPSDRSRTSDDLRQNYKSVVTQQGRVILDRDFNAMQEILQGELAADAVDIIGPCGTPDDGFKIEVTPGGSPPNLWVPPAPRSPPLQLDPLDFLIAPGTMYIGGQRAVFPLRSAGQAGPLSYSYFDQPDWINPPAPANSGGTEVISLHLFEQEVSAVEDPDLLDVALGGPDTTQRVRLMRRVERGPGAACADAASDWSQRGFKLDPKTMRLLPRVKLQASYVSPVSAKNPCDPVATGGYLGAFNQLIRIEVRNPAGGSAGLLWGYDNASSLYRVTVAADGQTLTLAQAPVDVFHQPAQNQIIEVLRTAAVLADDPNASDPTQPRTLRCVAEARGHVTTLSSGYAANADGSGTVVLATPLPAEYTSDIQLFLRIWQGKTKLGATASQVVELIDFTNVSTGLSVTLTVPTGSTLPHGAFWMIAVRPGTPQVVYPERFLESAQPPDGPNQWMCPLAVIDWTGGSAITSSREAASNAQVVNDCRAKFCNLVGLTKRERGSCCTYRVGDGVTTFGDFTSIQAAINHLPPEGGEICVLAGRYFETLIIAKRRDVVIHGCGGETRIASPTFQPDAGNTAAPDPNNAVITIESSSHVELRSLVVEADQGATGILIGAAQASAKMDNARTIDIATSDVKLNDLIVIASDQPAIWSAANNFCMEHCTVAMQSGESDVHAVYVQGRELHIVENWVGLLSAAVLPAIVESDFRAHIQLADKVEVEMTRNQAGLETVQAARNTTGAETVLTPHNPVGLETIPAARNIEVAVPGGIQVGGPSRDVYILRNEIQGGSGNGITLGNLRAINSDGNWIDIMVPFQPPGTMTGDCCGRTLLFPPEVTGNGNTKGRIVVGGPLVNIHIENNRIRNMGLCGIGPVGFFNLGENQEIVSVNELFIVGNEISHCPNQMIQALDEKLSGMMGYGAICLPDASGLVIRDNQILNTGATLSDPVCGIFLLHGEQVEISRNQILDSRAASTANVKTLSGLRAGISIVMVTPPAAPQATAAYVETNISEYNSLGSKTEQSAYLDGVPALCIRDNVVSVPLDLALSVAGLGAFSIQNNHFATNGAATARATIIAAGVMIMNFGTPMEKPTPVTTAAEFLSALETWSEGASVFEAEQAGSAASSIVGTLAPGPVLFCDNRCSVAINAQSQSGDKRAALASVFIATGDDLGFHENQCSLQCLEQQVVCDVFLLGATIRVVGNRFQERRKFVLFSNLSIGVMNISSLNISTNLLWALGPALVNNGNLIV